MEGFVRHRSRGASPQTAEHRQPAINAKRQASGANAKVSLKKIGQSNQPQIQSKVPTRGLGNVQNSSAIIHQHPIQHRLSTRAQEKEPDSYDTDPESLDTTVNLSVVQVEDSQGKGQQFPEHQQVIDLANDSDEDEFEDDIDFDDDGFTPQENHLFAQSDLLKLSREEKQAFLLQARGVPATDHDDYHMEGDSYPSTTDGNPTEWEGGPEPPSTDLDHYGGIATAPQSQIKVEQIDRPFMARSFQQGQISNAMRANQILHNPSNIPPPPASHRDEQVFMGHFQPRGPVHQVTTNALPTSQPPTYSQANINTNPSIPSHFHNRPNVPRQNALPSQHAHRQEFDRTQVQIRPSRNREPPESSKAVHSVPTNTQPVMKQQSVAEISAQEASTFPEGDYDHKKLFTMSYDQLKQESFDYNPGTDPQVLPNDILQNTLEERLEFAQKNLDLERQSDFFSSLPINEWEDTGDWFLDQFQKIIERMKNARRAKRKLAQDFEDEVEGRYTHVLKKQRQVEGAMNKMKMQGEGLVARSPRPSKSPKPKRA